MKKIAASVRVVYFLRLPLIWTECKINFFDEINPKFMYLYGSMNELFRSFYRF